MNDIAKKKDGVRLQQFVEFMAERFKRLDSWFAIINELELAQPTAKNVEAKKNAYGSIYDELQVFLRRKRAIDAILIPVLSDEAFVKQHPEVAKQLRYVVVYLQYIEELANKIKQIGAIVEREAHALQAKNFEDFKTDSI